MLAVFLFHAERVEVIFTRLRLLIHAGEVLPKVLLGFGNEGLAQHEQVFAVVAHQHTGQLVADQCSKRVAVAVLTALHLNEFGEHSVEVIQ